MFSLKDICDVAIQIEKNGERVYRNAQAKAEDENIKEVLGWMADEEKKHSQWFRKLAESVDIPVEHPQIEEMGKNLLKDSVGDQSFSLNETDLSQAADLHQVIHQSIEFERDTIIFYEMLREFIEDKTILWQLEKIIEEEKSHINKLSVFSNYESV